MGSSPKAEAAMCRPPSWEEFITKPVKEEEGGEEPSRPPGWENFPPQINDDHKEKEEDEAAKEEMSRPPGWENFVPTPPNPVYINLEKSMRSSEEISPPPGWETTGSQAAPARGVTEEEPVVTGAVKLAENMGSSPEIAALPGWENICPQSTPLPGSENLTRCMDSSQKTFLTSGRGKTNPQSSTPGLENLEDIATSPASTGPPGWENSCLQPPPPFPGSLSIEKSMTSSPEILTPPGWENVEPIPPPLPGSPSIEKSRASSPEILAPPGWENVGSEPIPPPVPEMGQMVCGSCRQLLSYPRGAMHVKCSCCRVINFVLEEHQVGNVKCKRCLVLLMYPYGAPSVRCSSCRFVTEIGSHNRRPRLSEQQGRPPPPLQNPMH